MHCIIFIHRYRVIHSEAIGYLTLNHHVINNEVSAGPLILIKFTIDFNSRSIKD